jgi:1-acyl-sn-glycerol-3-phosphate acyltransferase
MQRTLFENRFLMGVLSRPAAFMMRRAGWRVEGQPPALPKYVIVGAPHTSNWDFLVMLGAVFTVGIEMFWLGKHTLFKPPFGGLFRWLGGIPVDRRQANGLVDQLVDTFHAHEKLVLVVPPEGSRKKLKTWKSGFYHIARGAQVPLALVVMDYGRKVVGFGPVLTPTGDVEADMVSIRSFFASAVGKFPHETAQIALK